ncbi:hypothetical protein VTI74DRAFT_11228 [Chaetomium olivicolor]
MDRCRLLVLGFRFANEARPVVGNSDSAAYRRALVFYRFPDTLYCLENEPLPTNGVILCSLSFPTSKHGAKRPEDVLAYPNYCALFTRPWHRQAEAMDCLWVAAA